jgi:hypothetical protein
MSLSVHAVEAGAGTLEARSRYVGGPEQVRWRPTDALVSDENGLFISVPSVYFCPLWGKIYPLGVKLWRRNWAEPTTFCGFTPELRRVMYMTNMIGGLKPPTAHSDQKQERASHGSVAAQADVFGDARRSAQSTGQPQVMKPTVETFRE